MRSRHEVEVARWDPTIRCKPIETREQRRRRKRVKALVKASKRRNR